MAAESLTPAVDALEQLFEQRGPLAATSDDDRKLQVIAELAMDGCVRSALPNAASGRPGPHPMPDEKRAAIIRAHEAKKLMEFLPPDKMDNSDSQAHLGGTRHVLLASLFGGWLAACSSMNEVEWRRLGEYILSLPMPGVYTKGAFETVMRESFAEASKDALGDFLDQANTSHNYVVVQKAIQTLIGKGNIPIGDLLQVVRIFRADPPF